MNFRYCMPPGTRKLIHFISIVFSGKLKMDDNSDLAKTPKLKKMELLQSGVAALYQDKLLCDVQLQAEGKIFSAHRTVLAAVTDYFKAMFTGGYKESTEVDKPIVLEGISASGLEVILDAIYTTELKVTPDNILETIQIACMMQIPPMIEESEEFLISSICAEKFFIYAETAEKFSLKKASECFAKYKKVHFTEICKTIGFKQLEVTDLLSYLSLPDIYLYGQEITAFNAAVTWLEYKPRERKKHVFCVFQCINLLQMPTTDITDKVSKVKMVMDNPECVSLIMEALKYHGHPLTQPLYKGKIRNTRGVANGMMAFPLMHSQEEVEHVANYQELFDGFNPLSVFWKYPSIEEEENFNPLATFMPRQSKPKDFVVCNIPDVLDTSESICIKIGNFLFLFGEREVGDSRVTETLRYNPMLNTWIRLSSAPVNLDSSKYIIAQCSEEHIMVLGAERGGPASLRPHSKFYFVYSIADDTWTKGQGSGSLHLKMWTRAAYHNGTLYITDGISLVSYDRNKDMWIKVSTLNVAAHFMQPISHLVGLGKSLYLVTEPADNLIVEYNLETKTLLKSPNPCPLSYTLTGVFSHGKHLYFILRDVLSNGLTKLHRFDPSNNTCMASLVREFPDIPCDWCLVPFVLPWY